MDQFGKNLICRVYKHEEYKYDQRKRNKTRTDLKKSLDIKHKFNKILTIKQKY